MENILQTIVLPPTPLNLSEKSSIYKKCINKIYLTENYVLVFKSYMKYHNNYCLDFKVIHPHSAAIKVFNSSISTTCYNLLN